MPPPSSGHEHIRRGIALRIGAVACFSIMSALLKLVAERGVVALEMPFRLRIVSRLQALQARAGLFQHNSTIADSSRLARAEAVHLCNKPLFMCIGGTYDAFRRRSLSTELTTNRGRLTSA
jgi:hypothetical protein